MIIYCDGIFDMFHYGHIEHLRKAKKLYDDVYLIVGIVSDKDATGYKRKPIMNEEIRYELVKSIIYVDKVIKNAPMVTTKEFMDSNNIDLIVHSFSNENDSTNQDEYFKYPRQVNKMLELPYTKGISTTNIINNNYDNISNWKSIWNKKASEDVSLRVLGGYENTDMIPEDTYNNIITNLDLEKNDKILEVGCGCGYIAQFLKDYDYTGIDYSQSSIFKHFSLLNNKVITCEAYPLPFPDNYFDGVFANGVFEYFPSLEYTRKVIEEMNRVSKNKVYILNMRENSKKDKTKYIYEGDYDHNILSKDFFLNNNWFIKEATWDKKNRFSALNK